MKTKIQPDLQKQSLARAFSYSTFTLLMGAMIYLFTNNLISLTLRPDVSGTLALVGFGLVYGNMSFFISRRYLRKKFHYKNFTYITALILVFPAVLLIRIKQDVFFDAGAEFTFYFVLVAGVLAGAYFGIKKGIKMQDDTRRDGLKSSITVKK